MSPPPAWTLTPDEYRTSREASSRAHSEWMEETFGPLTGDAQVVDLGELLAEQQRDNEGEEWKRAEDAADDAPRPPDTH